MFVISYWILLSWFLLWQRKVFIYYAKFKFDGRWSVSSVLSTVDVTNEFSELSLQLFIYFWRWQNLQIYSWPSLAFGVHRSCLGAKQKLPILYDSYLSCIFMLNVYCTCFTNCRLMNLDVVTTDSEFSLYLQSFLFKDF